MSTTETDDKYLWLEQIDSKEALDWVKSHNTHNNTPEFHALKKRFCEILDSNEKIPYVEKGPEVSPDVVYYYNLWKNQENKLGLWRRTTFSEYQKKNPIWETVL